MSPHGNDTHAASDDDDARDDVHRVGMLDDQPGVNTSSIGVLGVTTAHVNIELPVDDEDGDDDVVDEDVRIFEAVLEARTAPIDAPARVSRPEDVVTAEVVVDRTGGAAADEPEDQEGDGTPAAGSAPIDEPEAAPAPGARESESAPGSSPGAPPPPVRADGVDDTMPTGLEDGATAAQPEKTTMTDPTEPDSATSDSAALATRAAARDVGRTPTHETQVLTSRRIGELSEGSVRETPDLLTTDRLLEHSRIARPEPEGAWQHLIYSLTGGRVNLGDSRRVRARKDLDRRIAASLPGGGARFVAVLSRKGGVGKTTITTLLGMALADARDDRIIAVDANPDRGTLAERIARPGAGTVRDMVRESGSLRGYNDVSAIVARDETRLDVLASDADPHVSEAFSDDEYRTVAEVAAHYYSIVLTDTGTGIVHSVMGATLDLSDQLIIVAGMSIDEARLASETLSWLESNGHEAQVRQTIVVLNSASPGAPLVRQDEVEAHFRSRVRDVVRVPYDPQIATGGPIVFRDLQPATRAAARALAARVVEGLRAPSRAE